MIRSRAGFPYSASDPINLIDPNGYCGFVNGIGNAAAAYGAFARNYVDMLSADTIGADKYFHCKANCEATQLGCGQLAEHLSDVREWYQENYDGDTPVQCEDDQDANRWGRENADTGESCSEVCDFYRPNGLPARY
jgi:hypothetical protein